MNVEVNYLAVALAMVSSMVVGSIWYSMSVFGKTWVKLAKIDFDMSKRKDVWKPIVATLIVSTITAYVLAHVAFLSNSFYGNSFLMDSLTTGFWLWLGLTAARMVTHDAFEGRPTKLTVLTTSHEFVTIMLMALIIGVMKP